MRVRSTAWHAMPHGTARLSASAARVCVRCTIARTARSHPCLLWQAFDVYLREAGCWHGHGASAPTKRKPNSHAAAAPAPGRKQAGRSSGGGDDAKGKTKRARGKRVADVQVPASVLALSHFYVHKSLMAGIDGDKKVVLPDTFAHVCISTSARFNLDLQLVVVDVGRVLPYPLGSMVWAHGSCPGGPRVAYTALRARWTHLTAALVHAHARVYVCCGYC